MASLLALSAAGAVAQITPDLPEPITPPKQTTTTFGEVFASVESAQPNRRAGLRSSLLAQSMQVVPMVVIVESPGAYLDAISGWEGPIKYPILYDDGTDLSREHIARFVRAFDPERVVRVTADGSSKWGSTAQARQSAINAAFAGAIQQQEPDWRATLDAIEETGVVSPGVVVIDPMDRHWAGGLALAAGRFEPIIYLSGPKNDGKELEPSQAAAINQAIEQGLIKLGRSFNQIGDETDAITLALRTGIKVRVGPQDRDRRATTDLIGRAADSLGGMRWAWSGQLMGSTSSGVYQAMCSLFLPIESAFIWDGYPTDGDWARYDGTEASDVLSGTGMVTELFDSPRASLAGFKGRASSGPVDASLILMNTKGAQAYFDLPMAPEGQGKPGDLPMLAKPSALHIVHSFSLSNPHNPKTLGGRWLERGVYLYAGSVDEPFLSGFVPTPMVARRMLGQLAFASAVHYDDGQAWKIAVIGDPLKTVGPCGTRLDPDADAIDTMIEQWGGEQLDSRAKQQLKSGDYTGAIEDFVLVGRDEAVVRLASALLRDKPEAIDDDGAKMVIQAAMRQKEHELVLDCFERLSAGARTDSMTLDALWMAGRYRLLRFSDDRAMALLRTNLRDPQIVQDAEEIAKVIRQRSLSEAVTFLESIRPDLPHAGQARMLNQALERLRK